VKSKVAKNRCGHKHTWIRRSVLRLTT